MTTFRVKDLRFPCSYIGSVKYLLDGGLQYILNKHKNKTLYWKAIFFFDILAWTHNNTMSQQNNF